MLGSESGFGSHVAALAILVFFSLLTFRQYVYSEGHGKVKVSKSNKSSGN